MRWFITVIVLGAAFAGTAYPADEEAPPAKEAEEKPAEDPKIAEARRVLVSYLDALKKKKWKDAEKFVHPKTLQVIADIHKRNKEGRHSMAPQDWEKCCFYLKNYSIEGGQVALNDTVVFSVKEDNWQVEEKGLTEGEPASYLIGMYKGKWYVTDKLQNDTFNDDGIRIGHKGYFDAEAKKPEPKKPESEGE
jgi:hypothetical protein